MRLAIWRNTLLVIAVYVVLIAAAHREIFAPAVRSRMLAGALSFAFVQLAFIAIMLILLFARKQRNVARTARSERLGPAIDEALALHSIGEDQAERLRDLAAESRYDVRERLFAIASTTRGDARDRMTSLALDLGLVERGVDVELDAMRDYIRVSHGRRVDDVVHWSAHRPLIARAIIADEMLPYAGEVSAEQLARALESPDRAVVLATLEMLRAWRRTVRVPGFTRLLTSGDAEVAAAAFMALPFAGEEDSDAILAGLRHADARVRRAAATASGRMKIGSMAEGLGALLDDEDREVAAAAAWALAAMGDLGLARLEAALASRTRRADVAFEMWEKAAMGRLRPA